MSAIERFKQAWNAKFPSEQPPEMPCLHPTPDLVHDGSVYGTVYRNLNPVSLEQALQSCNTTIAHLHLQLERQQFIADYLWDVIHSIETSSPPVEQKSIPTMPKKGTKSSVGSTRSPVPVQPLPVETDIDVAVSGGADSVLDNIVPIQESPSSSNFSPTSLNSGHQADSAADDAKLVRKYSLPLLDSDQSKTEVELSDSQRSSSNCDLDYADAGTGELELSGSSFKRSTGGRAYHRQKPVPTPRSSIQRQAVSPVVNVERSCADENASDDADVRSQKSSQHVTSTDASDSSSAADDKKTVSVKDRALAFTVAQSDSSAATGVSRSLKSNTLSPQNTGQRQRRAHRSPGYEEVVLLKNEADNVEETGALSSDDEEPLYYNLMMLQQTMLNRAKTFYAKGAQNVSPEKKKEKSRGRSSKDEAPDDFLNSLSGESVRSTDSEISSVGKSDNDRVTKHWRKRRSMYQATDSTEAETESHSDSEDIDTGLQICPEDEKLQMRKWVISSVLESEKTYLGILDILMQYMQTFRNCLGTPQSVLQATDIDIIFHGIPELHKAHKFFLHELEPCVANWSADQQIGDLFQTLAKEENQIAPEYLKNYQKAVFTIRRCWQENEFFANLTKEIQVKGMSEKPSLEELLHKPVVRFQRNTLVLHDLVKCTPTSHADYDLLQQTLSAAQDFIENFDGTTQRENMVSQRYLAKQGLIVEKVGGNTRKLRHMFLFNDVLICARQKISTKQRITFEAKWTIPLIDLALDDRIAVEEEKQLADCQQLEIEQLQRKVSELQGELKSELKHSRSAASGDGETHRQWSFHGRGKNMDKIRKKLIEQQAAMIKASPRLLFRVHNRRTNRQYTLLMASDYERSNWRSTIAGLLSRAKTAPNFSAAELHALLNSQKLPKVSALGALIGADDIGLEEEQLFGNLNIKVFKLNGLKHATDTYCAIEVDSFGHFFMKAKTNVCHSCVEPTWNQEFDVDLEGAQTVRFLIYQMNGVVSVLIGSCALELSKAWLRGDFLEKTISCSEGMSVTVSLRLVTREQTIKRTLSSAKGGVFGAKIKTVTKREGADIPLVVATCIEEVVQRGMNEVGIYRISGVSGEIQRLKKAFEKNAKVAAQLAKGSDIHVITGLLKLYFRELPESLFTDSLYPNLVTGMGLSDPEAKDNYLLSLLSSIPEPNHSTVVYLIDHLLSVAANEPENKMSLQNLATVFGPTVLRPAAKGSEVQTMEELFSSGTRDAMVQTSMLMTFLHLRKRGAQF